MCTFRMVCLKSHDKHMMGNLSRYDRSKKHAEPCKIRAAFDLSSKQCMLSCNFDIIWLQSDLYVFLANLHPIQWRGHTMFFLEHKNTMEFR